MELDFRILFIHPSSEGKKVVNSCLKCWTKEPDLEQGHVYRHFMTKTLFLLIE